MINNALKKSILKLVSLTLVLLSSVWLSAGCDLLLPPQPLPPTPTSTQTLVPSPTIDWFPDTPTPTALAIASPTPQPTLAGALTGISELLVEDYFTDDRLWLTPQGNTGNVAYGIENLSLAVAQPNAALTSLSQHTLPSNFYLELTVQTSLCGPLDQFGILFWHESDQDFYRLLLNCAGQTRLELIQGGASFVIRDWESASQMALAAPATNRLGLWVRDGQFQLFVNDMYQFEERIALDRSGALGVFARTCTGGAMTVRFSELKIFRVETD